MPACKVSPETFGALAAEQRGTPRQKKVHGWIHASGIVFITGQYSFLMDLGFISYDIIYERGEAPFIMGIGFYII